MASAVEHRQFHERRSAELAEPEVFADEDDESSDGEDAPASDGRARGLHEPQGSMGERAFQAALQRAAEVASRGIGARAVHCFLPSAWTTSSTFPVALRALLRGAA